MRVTSDMSQRHVLSDLRRVQERLANAQSQVSSGKRIEKPSDVPPPVPIHRDFSGSSSITALSMTIRVSTLWIGNSESRKT